MTDMPQEYMEEYSSVMLPVIDPEEPTEYTTTVEEVSE